MARQSEFARDVSVCVLLLVQVAPAQSFQLVQTDCTAARQLYDKAHQAQASKQFQYALQLLQAVRSEVPHRCRLETDEQLKQYEVNLKELIAQQKRRTGLTPCKPVRTGPTSYSCQ